MAVNTLREPRLTPAQLRRMRYYDETGEDTNTWCIDPRECGCLKETDEYDYEE